MNKRLIASLVLGIGLAFGLVALPGCGGESDTSGGKSITGKPAPADAKKGEAAPPPTKAKDKIKAVAGE